MQAIEAMDRNRVCDEYWDSRPYSRPQVHSPQLSQSTEISRNMQTTERNGIDPRPAGVDVVLRGLLKKANLEELSSLHTLLNDNRPTVDQSVLARLLNEEIQSHRRWFIAQCFDLTQLRAALIDFCKYRVVGISIRPLFFFPFFCTCFF